MLGTARQWIRENFCERAKESKREMASGMDSSGRLWQSFHHYRLMRTKSTRSIRPKSDFQPHKQSHRCIESSSKYQKPVARIYLNFPNAVRLIWLEFFACYWRGCWCCWLLLLLFRLLPRFLSCFRNFSTDWFAFPPPIQLFIAALNCWYIVTNIQLLYCVLIPCQIKRCIKDHAISWRSEKYRSKISIVW